MVEPRQPIGRLSSSVLQRTSKAMAYRRSKNKEGENWGNIRAPLNVNLQFTMQKSPGGLHMPTCAHCSSADFHQTEHLNYDVDEPTTN